MTALLYAAGFGELSLIEAIDKVALTMVGKDDL